MLEAATVGSRQGVLYLASALQWGQLPAQLDLNILQRFLVLTAQKPSKPGSFQQVPKACAQDLEHTPPVRTFRKQAVPQTMC